MLAIKMSMSFQKLSTMKFLELHAIYLNTSRRNFKNLVKEFQDIFRVRLGADSYVDVPPMNIEFEGSEMPIKVRQRTYSPEQLEFMKKKCDELIQVGYIYCNPTSKWACAPLIVPKPGKEHF
eukprot:IDg20848t1